MVTVRGTRRGIPAATLAMPIQMRGAINFTGFRSGHAVFRCMGEGWPQQHHNSNDDNTHVRNTHDREPYLFTGQSERRSRLGPVLCARQSIPAWVGHNETRLLSLMFVAEVNSGTRTASGEQLCAALRELHGRAAPVQFQPAPWRAPGRHRISAGRMDLVRRFDFGGVPRRCGAWPTK